MAESAERNRQALQRGLSLAKAGQHREAVAILRERLTESLEQSDSRWASRFARNIAVICDSNDLLEDALSAYQIAFQQDPGDGSLPYLMALLYERLGDSELAREALVQASGLARASSDGDLINACKVALSRMQARPD